jgi:hypothetical protein
VVGEHIEALTWRAADATYGPETGNSTLTIQVESLGRAQLMERALTSTAQGEFGTICADSISVDVRLVITTDGGALNETVETKLWSFSPELVAGKLRLPLARLDGSLEAEVAAPPWLMLPQPVEMVMQLGFSPRGDMGSLELVREAQQADGLVVTASQEMIAHFPAEHFCGAGRVSALTGEAAHGASDVDVLEELNAGSPATLQPGGAELSFTFANPSGRFCVSLDAPPGGSTYVSFQGEVTLSASDQSIAGVIPVSTSGNFTAGSVSFPSAQSDTYIFDPIEAGARVSQYAIQEVIDFSAYEGGRLQFHVDAISGRLAASGLACPTQAGAGAEGEPSGPGCTAEFAEQTQLWARTWLP